MKKISYSIMFLLLTCVVSFAQKELNYEIDYAKFKYDSASVYIEFYYSLDTKNMVVTKSDNNSFIEAIVHMELKDLVQDTFYINRDWRLQSLVDINNNNSGLKDQVGVIGYVVPNGKYSLSVKAYDFNNPELSKTIKETIEIKSFEQKSFSLSDIQLASNIKREDADPNSIFYKNTLEIIPNPSMVYSAQNPVAFYYVELYNLFLEDPNNDFTLLKSVFNSSGASVFKQAKVIKQGNKSLVEIGFVNLKKYPTGTYDIVFSLIDNKTNQAYQSSKRCFLYNPDVVDSTAIKIISQGVLGSEFALYNAEDCDRIFSQASYIASQNEKDFYKKLDSLGAKREFLYNFWKARDNDPSTPKNEFKDEYMKRVEYSNANFGFIGKDGYRTERGRVYLIYGEPDQRDYYPSEPNLKPYEIWFYQAIEGGVNFIFGDVTGFGNYELLHSTKRGEVRDENWARRISGQ